MRLIAKIVIRYSLSALLLLASASMACADDFSLNGDGDLPPTKKNDRIIKWCKIDGDHTRFASANLKIKGYEPCGTLDASSSCDASGNRLISKSDERPADHKDCATGPRIMIINHTGSRDFSYEKDGSVPPMSSKEKQELRRDVEAAEKQQSSDPDIVLQKMVTILTGGGKPGDPNQMEALLKLVPKKFLKKNANPKDPNPFDMGVILKELNSSLGKLDPKTMKSIKELIKNP